MRPSFISLALCVSFINQSLGLTYWIDDQSCTGKRDINKIVNEAKHMGTRTFERLKSSTDTDFENVYESLMKRKKSDKAELDTLQRFFSDVGVMQQIQDRNSANVRFYCDNERRWKQRVDPKTKQVVGGLEDPANWIRYDYDTPGCHDLDEDGERYTGAETYTDYMAGDPPEEQEALRVTMTMCELSLFDEEDENKPEPVLGDFKESHDFSTLSSLSDLRHLPDKLVLHELSHFHTYHTEDNAYFLEREPNSDEPCIRDLNAEELMKNADVLSYLGQLAVLADRGFTFQRKPADSAPQSEKDAWNENMRIGKLFLYQNLTKRSLKRRLERLARRYNKG